MSLVDGHWLGCKDGDARAFALFQRHYSYHRYKDNRRMFRKLFVGPGEKMVLMTVWCDALFAWRKFISDDGQTGVNAAVFRNESRILSSLLIEEACELAWAKWPGERLYTYINPKAIRSTNPGYCFKLAGFSPCGVTKVHKRVILERLPVVEVQRRAA